MWIHNSLFNYFLFMDIRLQSFPVENSSAMNSVVCMSSCTFAMSTYLDELLEVGFLGQRENANITLVDIANSPPYRLYLASFPSANEIYFQILYSCFSED